MNVHTYLAEHFPKNELNGGLYFDWPAGLHFELAKGIYQLDEDDSYNENRFGTANRQARSVLEEVIDDEDDLFLVLDVFHGRNYRKTRIFTKYMNNHSPKYKATTESFPPSSEDEPGWTRFSVPCQKTDLNINRLVAAACNEDFPDRTPRFVKSNKTRYPDLYIINKTKHLVAFIYDDRGMEVVAKEFEVLRSVGEKYKDFLQYSRPEQLV